jgi:hypothetical protein
VAIQPVALGAESQNAVAVSDSLALLQTHGLEAEPHWPWVSVGRSTREAGWKIHLSCEPRSLTVLIAHIVPVCARNKIPFKVAISSSAVSILNEGGFGDSQIGKCATVYPADDAEFYKLVNAFALISDVEGPKVPDDVWLGGIVNVRFGGFNPIIRRDALG